jgi:hypothetical protein
VFDGLVRLRKLDLRGNDLRGDDVSSLPPKIFSGLCGMQRLTLDGDSFHDEVFAGATLCSAIGQPPNPNGNATNACDEQADEDSVRACGCIRGACSECELEGECGGHNWCAWEADDSELGGSCSDPLVAPTAMSFFECADFCSHDVEGGRIPCIASTEDNNELWGRDLGEKTCKGRGLDGRCAWVGYVQTEENAGLHLAAEDEERKWLDSTCESSFVDWNANQPGNDGGYDERCTIARTNGGSTDDHVDVMGWSDEGCDDKHNCICQHTAEPPSIDFKWLADEILPTCAEGTATFCLPCEAGAAAAGDAACAACPLGFFASSAEAAENGWCLGCAAGKYGTVEGSTSEADCQPCEAGKTSVAGSECACCGARLLLRPANSSFRARCVLYLRRHTVVALRGRLQHVGLPELGRVASV